MGLVHNFGGTTLELNSGGRQHIYLCTFEKFLLELIKAGASLAFFCDGQLRDEKSDEWCRRRDSEYQSSLSLMRSENNNGSKFKRRFGCKSIAKSLLKLINDNKYGEVVIATHVDCDAAIAQYAAHENALAVVANDSDFLIFDGQFQWWESNSMRMDSMQANAFDRHKLLDLFNLTHAQMKYLATMAGNDYTKHLIKYRPNFYAISDYCRSTHFDADVMINLPRMLNFMKIGQHQQQDAMDCALKSIQSYDITFTMANEISNRLDAYCASNVLIYAFCNGKIFQYEVNFLDLNQRNSTNYNKNCGYQFVDTLLTVFRKLGGILLKGSSQQNPFQTLKIVTKYSMHKNYTLKKHIPIYPSGENNKNFHIFDINFSHANLVLNLN